ncbi:MAG: hypothetical protein IT382_19590, partial [Deltaproteobacteria bacterium]|nr:hypothetical protein [Deltaproteobacteria bacterium]
TAEAWLSEAPVARAAGAVQLAPGEGARLSLVLAREPVQGTGGLPSCRDGTPGCACEAAGDCILGLCRGGVCCQTICEEPCEGCAAPGALGRCVPAARGAQGDPACLQALACDGASSGCPQGCASSPDCPEGSFCEAGRCAPRLNDAARCTAAEQCRSGHCEDGVCCATACDGPCDACDAPSAVGTCQPRARGTPGVPSCVPYTCPGESVSCATTCASAPCSAGHACTSDSSCVAPLSSLTDDFADGQLDPARWVPYSCCGGGARLAEQSGQLQILTTPGQAGIAGAISASRYDARGGQLVVELASAGSASQGSRIVYAGLRRDLGNELLFTVQDGQLKAIKRVNASAVEVASAIFAPPSMRWLRLRESDGGVFWEYAANRSSYVALASQATPFALEGVTIYLLAGTTSAEDAGTTFAFDNVN